MGSELAVFAVIGVLSTVLHLGGFVLLRQVVESAPGGQRRRSAGRGGRQHLGEPRWTFRVRGRAGAARHQVQGCSSSCSRWR